MYESPMPPFADAMQRLSRAMAAGQNTNTVREEADASGRSDQGSPTPPQTINALRVCCFTGITRSEVTSFLHDHVNVRQSTASC